jgi:membrane-associated HD superfamily phosphohydrolase
MEILGNVAYAVLCLLAIVWILGVRMKPELSVGTIIGSMILTIAAILIPISGVSFAHSIWIIPLAYALPIVIMYMAGRYRIREPFRFLASIYAGVIRIGVSKKKPTLGI